jgi:hypothetical protein
MNYIGFVGMLLVLLVVVNIAPTNPGTTTLSMIAINALFAGWGALGIVAIALANSLSPKPRSSNH